MPEELEQAAWLIVVEIFALPTDGVINVWRNIESYGKLSHTAAVTDNNSSSLQCRKALYLESSIL